MNSLQLNLNHQVIEQQHFCEELDQFMLNNDVTERQRFKVITCALEGVNNILQHTECDAANITLLMHCNADKIIVDLLDTATFHSLPFPINCPQNNTEHGRGLWIMYNWMDQVQNQPTVLGSHLRMSLLRN
jgi:serine/threonine-protein kinase RsbW